ncbi:putative thiopurine S-methyltransferase [Halotydeus destructor]|nr:putative thiopurine S-methyltransferase [Halotydeus destructor]
MTITAELEVAVYHGSDLGDEDYECQSCEQETKPDQYLGMWRQLWAKRDTAWHLDRPNPTLQRFSHLLLQGRSRENPARVLFPFCGKNVDMKQLWLAGHTVFGVDCASEAINDFFSGHQIPFKSRSLKNSDNGRLNSTNDGRLNLIQHNFYTLDSDIVNGTIEAVWDRGAFGTITEREQEFYVATMQRLLAVNFRYLLLVLEFDSKLFTGLPYSQPEWKVRKYFGDFAHIEKLDSRIPDHVGLYQKHMGCPLEVRETTYLLSSKNEIIDKANGA